jgi:hypothetical protein
VLCDVDHARRRKTGDARDRSQDRHGLHFRPDPEASDLGELFRRDGFAEVDQDAGDRSTAVVAIELDRRRRPRGQVLRAPSLIGKHGYDVCGQRRDHLDVESRGDLAVGVGDEALHDEQVGVFARVLNPGDDFLHQTGELARPHHFRRSVERNWVRRLCVAKLARKVRRAVRLVDVELRLRNRLDEAGADAGKLQGADETQRQRRQSNLGRHRDQGRRCGGAKWRS